MEGGIGIKTFEKCEFSMNGYSEVRVITAVFENFTSGSTQHKVLNYSFPEVFPKKNTLIY